MNRSLSWMALIGLTMLMPALPASADDPLDISKQYLALLVEGKPDAAHVALMKHSDLDELRPREMENFKGQVSNAFSLYKSPLRFEEVADRRYGSSVVKLLFLTIHAELPITWEFTFFKSDVKWSLINVVFEDQMKLLE